MKLFVLLTSVALCSPVLAIRTTVLDLVPRASDPTILHARSPTQWPGQWSTSRQHGYQEDIRSRPERSPSRSPSPSPSGESRQKKKSPVEVHAKIRGPAKLTVVEGTRPQHAGEYEVPPGDDLEQRWKDPKKLRVKGRVSGEGSIRLDSYGSKLYTRVRGDPARSELWSGGPGLQRKKGKQSGFVTHATNAVVFTKSPIPAGTAPAYANDMLYVKNAARDGMVGSTGIAKGDPVDDWSQHIKTVVSNSPSHSPPPSPGRLVLPHPHLYPDGLTEMPRML